MKTRRTESPNLFGFYIFTYAHIPLGDIGVNLINKSLLSRNLLKSENIAVIKQALNDCEALRTRTFNQSINPQPYIFLFQIHLILMICYFRL